MVAEEMIDFKKEPIRLGRSQKAVFVLLQIEKVPFTAQFIGDKLYATTSSCAKYGNGTGSMGGFDQSRKDTRELGHKSPE